MKLYNDKKGKCILQLKRRIFFKLAEDGLTAREILTGILTSVVVEEYPDYPKGPCVLLLQKDRVGKPVHVVWGIPNGYEAGCSGHGIQA